MSSPFHQYASELESMAGAWPTIHPRTAAPVAEHVRYNAVSDIVVDAMSEVTPLLPDRLRSDNVRHSQKVMLRFCLVGACLGRDSDASLEELEKILADPRSFAALSTLASQQNKVARNTEGDFGILQHIYTLDSYYLDQFTVANEYLEPINLQESIALNKALVRQAGYEIYESQCSAHRAGVLEPIYRSMLIICMRDTNLFARTLETKSE